MTEISAPRLSLRVNMSFKDCSTVSFSFVTIIPTVNGLHAQTLGSSLPTVVLPTYVKVSPTTLLARGLAVNPVDPFFLPLAWLKDYWADLQVISKSHPDLALELIGPMLGLLGDFDEFKTLLEDQAKAEVNGMTYWKDPTLLSDPVARSKVIAMQQAFPLITRAWRHQSRIQSFTVGNRKALFLSLNDAWGWEIPGQLSPVDIALEEIEAPFGAAADGDFAGFKLSSTSTSFTGPIKVYFYNNCGPDGGKSDGIFLVNMKTSKLITPTFIQSCYPVEFDISDLGEYAIGILDGTEIDFPKWW